MSEILEIDPSQFLEEILALTLACQDITYTPISTYQTVLGFVNMAAIISSILDHVEEMSTNYERHINEVVLALSKNSKAEEYFGLVGKSLLMERKFNWNNFRSFLALVIKLLDLCYKKNLVVLSRDIILTTASFVEKNLQTRINDLKGWKNFEEDCIQVYTRLGIATEKPPEPQNLSASSEIASTSRKGVEVHAYSFNNESFGKCYTIKSSEEIDTEPIAYLRKATVQPSLQSLEETLKRMTLLVTEVIEVSMSALRQINTISNEIKTEVS